MKKANLVSFSVLLAILFMASAGFSQSVADYKSQIEKINKEMAKYMLEGNSEKNLELYAADAISMPSYEPMLEGIAAIRKSTEAMMKSGMKITSFEPVTVKVLVNGNMITEIGTYKMSMSMPGMEKPMNDHGKYLTIWEKQKDGSLKVKVDTWNTDVDPMSMMK
jgi:ketosteroid isomerase-like protein